MMNTDNNDMIALTKRVAELELRIVELRSDLRRYVKAFVVCDDIQDKFRRLADRDITDLFERLARVELALFPDLPKDLSAVDNIIGPGDGKAYHSEDFRKPKG